jgi:membrane-bound lytic murein transglycosylase D
METKDAGGRVPAGHRSSVPVRFAFVATTALVGLVFAALVFLSRSPMPAAGESPLPVLPEVTAELVHSRLPMAVNGRVEDWIRRFVGSDREVFESYLVREGLYGDLIRERLRARGMPEELIFLAAIESGFSPAATSASNAAGVWQFKGATAQEYGLVMDYWVDERRDPVRATDAALDYLEVLYGEFGSWHLAAAAYNAGPGLVRRTLARFPDSEASDDEMYWRIIDHLPLQTREYVPKMLAATLLSREADRFGFEVEKELPYLFDQVLVPGGTRLVEVAEALDQPQSLIRELNPHIVRGVTPPGRAILVRVPQGDSHRLVAEAGSGLL